MFRIRARQHQNHLYKQASHIACCHVGHSSLVEVVGHTAADPQPAGAFDACPDRKVVTYRHPAVGHVALAIRVAVAGRALRLPQQAVRPDGHCLRVSCLFACLGRHRTEHILQRLRKIADWAIKVAIWLQ